MSKTPETKPRQVGRWTDADWDTMRLAAKLAGTDVANFSRPAMLKRAKRVIELATAGELRKAKREMKK